MNCIDRQRLAPHYMRLIVVMGTLLSLRSIFYLPSTVLTLPFLLLALTSIAVGSRINIKLLRFKSNVSASDVFVFLAILLYDGEAAILLGAVESYCASISISKKVLTRLFNSAAMACSTTLTVATVRLILGPATDLTRAEYSSGLVIAICLMALVQYLTNSGLIAVAGALRAGLPILETWKKYYIWTSLTYFAGASAAGIIAKLSGVVGFFACIGALPIVGVIYFTYTTYLKNMESTAAQAEQARQYIEKLEASEGRFRSAFDHAHIGMALVTVEGRFVQVNDSLSRISGYSEQELLGMTYNQITHPEDLKTFIFYVNELVEGRVLTYQMEKRYLHRLGQEIWVLIGMSMAFDAESKSYHLILQVQDINDRKKAEQQLLHEAYHDSLTGLPNRAWFTEQLNRVIQSAKQQEEQSYAILFLDLDRFKVINDSLGHLLGDQLLIEVSRRLHECVRPEDRLARLGGDEFTILLEDTGSVDEAVAVAERIQKKISEPYELGDYETFTTVSIGIALADKDYQRPAELLRDADTAMYQAKSLGKARCVVFDKSMHAHALSLLKMETDLRRAIERREFFLQYQPIVSLDGTLKGFEALVRWQHPVLGLVSPESFISVAEETGLIVPLGQWVLHETCRQLRRWRDQYSEDQDLFISMNVSAKQFLHSGFIKEVVRTLEIIDVNPAALKLEITETALMENIEEVRSKLEQLKSLGVRLSIDDFGTGYSSLSYLHRLPIDTLKIDRSFVMHLNENNENKEIVRTIIVLARNLGMDVIAEGVETKEQLDELKELKCEYVQGYLFSRPVDGEAASKLVDNMAQGWSGLTETYHQGEEVAPCTYLM